MVNDQEGFYEAEYGDLMMSGKFRLGDHFDMEEIDTKDTYLDFEDDFDVDDVK